MNSEKRVRYIFERAYELAATGAHFSVITITNALVREGYPEALHVLGEEQIRSDLRRLCAKHRRDG